MLFDELGGTLTLGFDSVVSNFKGAIGSFNSSVTGLFDNLLEKLVELFNFLITRIREVLIYLYVPEDNIWLELKDKILEKFPFITQVSQIVSAFMNIDGSKEQPNFSITYYGSTVKIIDFSLFEDYIPVVQVIIIAIAWGSFIFRLYKRIPSIIGGFR